MSGLAGRGAAEEVKVRVSLPEALRRYGLPTSPRGRIACPIHGGEGPNFAYDQRRFHCFVCGAGGSVIDLVMGLFSLAYPQALVRLDEDFSLGLLLGRGDGRSRRQAAEAARRRAAERERREAGERAYRARRRPSAPRCGSCGCAPGNRPPGAGRGSPRPCRKTGWRRPIGCPTWSTGWRKTSDLKNGRRMDIEAIQIPNYTREDYLEGTAPYEIPLPIRGGPLCAGAAGPADGGAGPAAAGIRVQEDLWRVRQEAAGPAGPHLRPGGDPVCGPAAGTGHRPLAGRRGGGGDL